MSAFKKFKKYTADLMGDVNAIDDVHSRGLNANKVLNALKDAPVLNDAGKNLFNGTTGIATGILLPLSIAKNELKLKYLRNMNEEEKLEFEKKHNLTHDQALKFKALNNFLNWVALILFLPIIFSSVAAILSGLGVAGRFITFFSGAIPIISTVVDFTAGLGLFVIALDSFIKIIQSFAKRADAKRVLINSQTELELQLREYNFESRALDKLMARTPSQKAKMQERWAQRVREKLQTQNLSKAEIEARVQNFSSKVDAFIKARSRLHAINAKIVAGIGGTLAATAFAFAIMFGGMIGGPAAAILVAGVLFWRIGFKKPLTTFISWGIKKASQSRLTKEEKEQTDDLFKKKYSFDVYKENMASSDSRISTLNTQGDAMRDLSKFFGTIFTPLGNAMFGLLSSATFALSLLSRFIKNVLKLNKLVALTEKEIRKYEEKHNIKLTQSLVFKSLETPMNLFAFASLVPSVISGIATLLSFSHTSSFISFFAGKSAVAITNSIGFTSLYFLFIVSLLKIIQTSIKLTDAGKRLATQESILIFALKMNNIDLSVLSKLKINPSTKKEWKEALVNQVEAARGPEKGPEVASKLSKVIDDYFEAKEQVKTRRAKLMTNCASAIFLGTFIISCILFPPSSSAMIITTLCLLSWRLLLSKPLLSVARKIIDLAERGIAWVSHKWHSNNQPNNSHTEESSISIKPDSSLDTSEELSFVTENSVSIDDTPDPEASAHDEIGPHEDVDINQRPRELVKDNSDTSEIIRKPHPRHTNHNNFFTEKSEERTEEIKEKKLPTMRDLYQQYLDSRRHSDHNQFFPPEGKHGRKPVEQEESSKSSQNTL